MSHEKNFVSELVQMARAFEELPLVREELEKAKALIAQDAQTIQRLELRLIDAKNEIDAAHEATRKAEVERDHAETMFLETDQKLDTLRGIFSRFQGEVDAFVKATEPQPTPSAAHEVTVESPWVEGDSINAPLPSEAPAPTGGLPEPTSSESQPTNTGDVLNTTSPEEAGSSGVMGESDSPLPVSNQDPASGIGAEPVKPEEYVTSPGESAPLPSSATSTEVSSSVSTEPTADTTAPASAGDDVGYHNEPEPDGNPNWYSRWKDWSDRMTSRYPTGWPARAPATA